MKSEIYLSLDQHTDRPILEIPGMSGLLALLDTGARFPVWTADVDSLLAFGGQLIQTGVRYSGVGGETSGDIYRLPSLVLGDGTHSIIYPDLPVVTNADFENAPFQILLSATMLHDLEYTINDKTHSLTIRIPDDESEIRNARIKLDNDDFQVLFTSASVSVQGQSSGCSA